MPAVRFLLVNPWIHDFAAYDLWMRPLGLLQLHAFLRQQGYEVDYLDALHLRPDDAQRWGLERPEPRGDGRGKFHSQRIAKPPPYARIPRYYRRFGIPPGLLDEKLAALPHPDGILVTSGMTYWYPGVRETIRHLRKTFSQNAAGAKQAAGSGSPPIFLGGTYATLCTDHARRHSGADRVIPGPWETNLLPVLAGTFGLDCTRRDLSLDDLPFAANDLYPGSPTAAVRLTRGCPFSCDYCASDRLSAGFHTRSPDRFADEVEWNVAGGRTEIALYDDALLVDADRALIPALEEILRRDLPCHFHTPNGLHARYMTGRIARLFRRTGFRTVRLSFESVRGRARETSDGKAEPEDLSRAMDALLAAGYGPGEIDVYMLIGLPEQREEAIRETAQFIHSVGGKIRPAQYSPVPATPLFEKDKKRIEGLAEEPLLNNSTIAPGWNFETERYEELKRFVRGLNKGLKSK